MYGRYSPDYTSYCPVDIPHIKLFMQNIPT